MKKTFYKFIASLPGVRDGLQQVNHLAADLSVLRALISSRSYRAEMENSPRYQDPLRLPRYAFQVNSQNGEDGILQEIFRRIGAQDKTFVEIGVGDGAQNNTAFLLSLGWRGYWIDGNAAFLQTIQNRADLAGCISSRVSYVSRENICPLFAEMNIPLEFDLFSLDVDQNTYYIWESLSNYRPRVVVVEYNAFIPPQVNWKVNYAAERIWDGSQNFGASLKAYEILGSQMGYALVGCDFSGANAFFVRQDLIAENFSAPFTAENHYETPKYGYINWRGRRKATILDRASSS
ncbi:MAG: hypothetical protein Fur002_23260 [Anaerolineales bacterium]